MCVSMIDIQSAAAEIRRGKKKNERRRRRRTNHSMKIYMVSLFHRATINYLGWIQECSSCWHVQREAITREWLCSTLCGDLAQSLVDHVTMLPHSLEHLGSSVGPTPQRHINRHGVHVVSATRHDTVYMKHVKDASNLTHTWNAISCVMTETTTNETPPLLRVT